MTIINVLKRAFWTSIFAVAAATFSLTALAQVTTHVTNPGLATTSTKVTPGTPFTVQITVDTTVDTIGAAYLMAQQLPLGPAYPFQLTGRDLTGTAYTDPPNNSNAAVLAVPSALVQPNASVSGIPATMGTTGTDLGSFGFSAPLGFISPGTGIQVANLTFSTAPAAALGVYTLSPTPANAFMGSTNDPGPTCVAGFCNYDMSGATFTVTVGQPLTVTVNGTGTGNVTSVPAGINCPGTCSDIFPGTTVTLTATNGTGIFAGWTGPDAGACGVNPTCAVTVDHVAAITATFNLPSFNLTVTESGTGAGTVTSVPAGINCPGTCTAPYVSGTMVTLTAAPGVGSTFVGWSGGGCAGTGTCTVTVSALTTVNAQFDIQTFALNVTLPGTGVGTVTSPTPPAINCPGVCTGTYNFGTVITLTATPTAPSVFAGWGGAGAACGVAPTCAVTMNAIQNVTATFSPPTSIQVVLAGSGTGTVASVPAGIACAPTCFSAFASGTVVTLTATPNAGSVFAGWSGAGCAGVGTCVITVNAANTVTATFTAQRTLTVTLAGAGTGTVTSVPAGINCPGTCSSVQLDGTVMTLTATPAAGSSFTGWAGGGCAGVGTCVVTLNADTTVTATFSTNFVLTVNKTPPPVGNGTGLVTSVPAGINCATACTTANAPFASGTVVTLTATPDPGQNFTGWAGGGCAGVGTCTVTMNAATTVTATFTDTTPPDTTITGFPPNPSNNPNPVFTFTSTEAGSTFRCQLDAGPVFNCATPYTATVTNGNHTFSVAAVDPGGNVDPSPATYSWTAAGVPLAAPIPTMSQWALALMALLLAAMGFVVLGRRGQ